MTFLTLTFLSGIKINAIAKYFFYYSKINAINYRHAATPPHNKLRRNLTECFNINITLDRLNCKLPDDGRRPKHVGSI